jgi:hypothetical protein
VELERLRDLHRDLPQKTRHGGDLEIEYVAQDQLRPWGIAGETVSISPGQALRVEKQCCGRRHPGCRRIRGTGVWS